MKKIIFVLAIFPVCLFAEKTNYELIEEKKRIALEKINEKLINYGLTQALEITKGNIQ